MMVPELQIDGPFEEQWGTMKSAVKQLHVDVYGNGHQGMRDYIVGLKAQQRLIITLVSFFGIVSTAGLFLVALLEYHR